MLPKEEMKLESVRKWWLPRKKVVKCGPEFEKLLTAGRGECSNVFAAGGSNHL